jgi:tetratricopeptide (TPR) repeat protein
MNKGAFSGCGWLSAECNPAKRGKRNFSLERGVMRNRLGKLVSLAVILFVSAMGYAQGTPPEDKAVQARALIRAGDALMARKNYEDAIVQYRKAQALTPREASISNKLGIAYQDIQDFSKAKKSYEQAVKLNPKYAEAWNNMGTIYYLQKNYKKAITQYQKAIEINPQFAAAFNNLGGALFARKSYEEGFKAYLEAYRLDPSILERASAGGGSVLKTSTTNEAMQNFYMAKLFAGNGNLERALLYLAKAQEKGFKEFDKVEKDPVFKELIKDERYQQLVHPKPEGK